MGEGDRDRGVADVVPELSTIFIYGVGIARAMASGMLRRVWGELWSPLYRNAFFLIASSVLSNALGFLFWIVVARFYASSDVGLAAAAITTVGFLAGIANLGFSVGLVRFLPEAGERGSAMINTSLTISSLAGLAAATIFLAGLGLWAPPLFFLRNEPILLATFVLMGAVLAAAPTLDAILIARRRADFVFLKGAVMGLRVPLPAALAAFFGVFGIFGSWALAVFASVIVALLLFVPRVEPRYRPRPLVRTAVVNDLVHFSFANYVPAVIGAMPAGLLPLLIVNVLGAASTAHFFVTFSLAGLLFVIPGAFVMSLYAEGSQPVADFPKDTRKTARMIVALLVPGVLVFLFFGDVVLRLFGGEYSDAGFGLLRLFALSAGFVAVNGVYVTQLRVEKRVRPIIGLTAMATAFALGLSYVFLGSLGLLGVGVAWLVAQGSVTAYAVAAWMGARPA